MWIRNEHIPFSFRGVLFIFLYIGVTQKCSFMDIDEKTSDVLMQVNFKAPFILMQGVIPGQVKLMLPSYSGPSRTEDSLG